MQQQYFLTLMDLNMSRKRSSKPASCHPHKRHEARGLCTACYFKTRYSTPENNKRRTLRHRYKMTLEQFEARKVAQNNTCAICESSASRLVVDHCHKTNLVRGLLCDHCNSYLGTIERNPRAILTNLIMYWAPRLRRNEIV